MALALTGQISLALESALTNALDLSTPRDPLQLSWTQTIASGSGTGQANKHFHDQYTISASGTQAVDLAGSVTNAFGQTVSFTRLKALLVVNSGATDITIEPNVSSGFSAMFADVVTIKAGGVFLLAGFDSSGYTVASGSADQLLITNLSSGASATVSVVAIGA